MSLIKIMNLLLEDVFMMLFGFLIPVGITKRFFKVTLKDLGLRIPYIDATTAFLTAAAFIFFIPMVYFLLSSTNVKHFYALTQHSTSELWIMMALSPMYYFFEEFFFRGFLFLGLWRRVKWHSFWITDIIFTLSHVGKPMPEILACIPASIVFNILTLYTKSIYPAVLVHGYIGLYCLYI